MDQENQSVWGRDPNFSTETLTLGFTGEDRESTGDWLEEHGPCSSVLYPAVTQRIASTHIVPHKKCIHTLSSCQQDVFTRNSGWLLKCLA